MQKGFLSSPSVNKDTRAAARSGGSCKENVAELAAHMKRSKESEVGTVGNTGVVQPRKALRTVIPHDSVSASVEDLLATPCPPILQVDGHIQGESNGVGKTYVALTQLIRLCHMLMIRMII